MTTAMRPFLALLIAALLVAMSPARAQPMPFQIQVPTTAVVQQEFAVRIYYPGGLGAFIFLDLPSAVVCIEGCDDDADGSDCFASFSAVYCDFRVRATEAGLQALTGRAVTVLGQVFVSSGTVLVSEPTAVPTWTATGSWVLLLLILVLAYVGRRRFDPRTVRTPR